MLEFDQVIMQAPKLKILFELDTPNDKLHSFFCTYYMRSVCYMYGLYLQCDHCKSIHL